MRESAEWMWALDMHAPQSAVATSSTPSSRVLESALPHIMRIWSTLLGAPRRFWLMTWIRWFLSQHLNIRQTHQSDGRVKCVSDSPS